MCKKSSFGSLVVTFGQGKPKTCFVHKQSYLHLVHMPKGRVSCENTWSCFYYLTYVHVTDIRTYQGVRSKFYQHCKFFFLNGRSTIIGCRSSLILGVDSSCYKQSQDCKPDPKISVGLAEDVWLDTKLKFQQKNDWIGKVWKPCNIELENGDDKRTHSLISDDRE